MFVSVKETIWTNYTLSDKADKKEIIKRLANGIKPWEMEEFEESENLFETSEEISIEDNDGYATIELYGDNNEIIYKNGL